MLLTRHQVREFDRQATQDFKVPSIVLMENAGRGAVEVLLTTLNVRGPVTVCCAHGNNGGDGLVMARHLDLHGIPVRVLLFAAPEKLAGDAAINYNIVRRSGLPVQILPPDALQIDQLPPDWLSSEWLIDALFGSGLQGAVRSPFDQVIDLLNRSGRPIVAVDIPSGLDCDTGDAMGTTVRATETITFVAAKKGFAAEKARRWLGRVHVVDIGAPRVLLERFGLPGASGS